MKAGRARRIVKPGQVFNRIHVGDLADIIDGAISPGLSRGAGGIFNAADDEPTAPGDPIAYAAGLLGVAPPPEIPFEEAKKTMSPFAISFYGESKRVRNARIKSVLGVTLRYPTYREGLQALAGKDSRAGPRSTSARAGRRSEPGIRDGSKPALSPWVPGSVLPHRPGMTTAQNSATAASRRSMSSGRDRRWSPSLTKVSTTSSWASRETSSTA